jgi:hypothetical protein
VIDGPGTSVLCCAPKDCYVAGIIITENFEECTWQTFQEMDLKPSFESRAYFCHLTQETLVSPLDLLEPDCVNFLSRHVVRLGFRKLLV